MSGWVYHESFTFMRIMYCVSPVQFLPKKQTEVLFPEMSFFRFVEDPERRVVCVAELPYGETEWKIRK